MTQSAREAQADLESFELDHTKVVAPYVRLAGRYAGPHGDVVTKYDLRLVQPNRAEIPTAEAVIGQVAIQHYGVEHSVHHAPPSGYAVTKRAKSSPARTTQTVTTLADAPAGPTSVARMMYFCP